MARDDCVPAVEYAARNGHRRVCEWLHATFQLTREEALAGQTLAAAAAGVHVGVIEWLEEFEPDITELEQLATNSPLLTQVALCRITAPRRFKIAAGCGNIGMCATLSRMYCLGPSVARGALIVAAANGELDTCHWLDQTYSLAHTDVRAHSIEALRRAAGNRQRVVCRWLVATYWLTPADLEEAAANSTPEGVALLETLKPC